MDSFLNSGKTNPRGIPSAPFIENVDELIKDPKDFQMMFNKLQERLNKYKFMQESKQSTLKQLNQRLPDMEASLKMVQLLHEGKLDQLNYQLNDTLYTKAKVLPHSDTGGLPKVNLWLGADVMMEYTTLEAIELLEKRIHDSQTSLSNCQEDLEFLRENITTMEVNCARLYNWDVQTRKKTQVQ